MDVFIAAFLIATGLILCSSLVEVLLEQLDRRRFPAPGRLVRVEDRYIHVLCSGERQPGRPLVVLEAGMGSWSFYWRLGQPVLSTSARVCSYDRLGFGWSDRGAKPRSAQVIATELHTALQEAGEAGRYLLVGHSLGGIFVRQFARLYPDEVTGMVLVDSAHEDQIERMPWAREQAKNIRIFLTLLAVLHRLGILRLMAKRLLSRFTSLRTTDEEQFFLAVLLASHYFETSRDESLSLLNPPGHHERLSSLEGKPLVVIQVGGQPKELPKGYTPERWREQRHAWDEIQRELAALSSNSRLVIAENSTHAVQLEQPEVVIEAVCQLLKETL